MDAGRLLFERAFLVSVDAGRLFERVAGPAWRDELRAKCCQQAAGGTSLISDQFGRGCFRCVVGVGRGCRPAGRPYGVKFDPVYQLFSVPFRWNTHTPGSHVFFGGGPFSLHGGTVCDRLSFFSRVHRSECSKGLLYRANLALACGVRGVSK